MAIQEAYTQLMYQLFELYDDREAANIAGWVIEHITGFKKIDRITNKKFPLSQQQQQLLETFTAQLLQHKPVQYVLHEAWFASINLYVDEHVLIPRPETEELVEWIGNELSGSKLNGLNVLDIGTGSGCIPVALKKRIQSLNVHALDVSKDALQVAQKNAALQNTQITFHYSDILDKEQWNMLPNFDIIVSNPPYIRQSEANEMQHNVLNYEPHLALFVPDENPLIFYAAIVAFGLQHLNNNGKVFVEINESAGDETCLLFADYGYTNIELKKDMQGKDRMIKAEKKAAIT